jgi:hypothetical protein
MAAPKKAKANLPPALRGGEGRTRYKTVKPQSSLEARVKALEEWAADMGWDVVAAGSVLNPMPQKPPKQSKGDQDGSTKSTSK